MSSDVAAFHKVLGRAKRILAICGAGLSASSGLPTFRGAGGLWRNYESTSLATPQAFARDPGLVWLFYGYRRHVALGVSPNDGHRALAKLAERQPGFLCLTQNVDNLHERAGHSVGQLRHLHGSLFDLKCSNRRCDWVEQNNQDDPLCPALAPSSIDAAPGERLTLLDPAQELEPIPESELPHCPRCKKGLQRPGVVWFGEQLDHAMLAEVDAWIDAGSVDIVLVVGTSSVVYPAAGYAERARSAGTSVVTVNLDADIDECRPGDFAFAGDAAKLLPELLEPVIGKL
ncbi:DHS-like NAD/FAD-binding domain-containing protein [Cutaneotrichosporon oleaginosum]|uniref:DHS-like NAD/FAD-binding domain-containing protein n=1 Tax=Cutaneotrichosporon oleaginosum TaxID=879819 RepID=A0A0J0XRV2_9TREE|nr:DHS-like NAD/FAD-binding domain-containing protein [Cutaneotrichosporon oleaginosum]KLT43856.1 DHS-like NAD/FAD-binding domain-containing protein [Cutaneotrichosporon oleaginosum]TXT06404.1 hypothetical protein COLE_05735 [Cutaneotrichosporon oleaginosum]